MSVERPHTHFEAADVRSRPLIWIAAGLGFFLIAAVAILIPLFQFYRSIDPRPVMTPLKQTPHSLPSPAQALAKEGGGAIASADQNEALNRTEWVDKSRGIARIPIEDAMEVIAKHGMPHWEQKSSQAAPGAAK